jgi:hypothetical protein
MVAEKIIRQLVEIGRIFDLGHLAQEWNRTR